MASDRIPAITGLGKEIASIAGTKFVNGMFKPTSAVELSWERRSSQPMRRIPGIPSWSWASLEQRVLFSHSTANFQLLARRATVDGQQIHICGRLGNLPVTSFDSFSQRWYSSREQHSDERISFDVEQDAPQGEEGICRCVQWMKWQDRDYCSPWHPMETWLGIILISAVDEAQQIYRRIGWAEILDGQYFDEDFTDITLI